MLKDLKRLTDVAFVQRYGLSTWMTREKRRALGIVRNPNALRLSPGRKNLLGRFPDTELGKRWGVSRDAVRIQREKYGIPACKSREVQWTKRMIEALGSVSDLELAKRLHICSRTIADKRKALRIPAHPKVTQWVPKMLKRLGQEPDKNLARELRISLSTVRDKRNALGISAYHDEYSFPQVNWTPRMIARLGNVPDAVLVREWGIGINTIRVKRAALGIPACARALQTQHWPDEIVQKLGTQSDGTLAMLIGTSILVMREERKRRKIPPFNPGSAFQWTSKKIALLGRSKDESLAYAFGIGSTTVTQKRRNLGIRAFRRTKRS